jgi:broad specificity phosphatase PhoE
MVQVDGAVASTSGPSSTAQRHMNEAPHLRVLFETHATSVDNEAGLASGFFDVALSSVGEEQARALGARRRDDDLAAVFSSDLQRASRTAAIAFGGRSLRVMRDARLRECDYGRLTRRPVQEIEAQRAAHIITPFPEGESYQQVAWRVATWLDEVARDYARRTVLVVGHRATFYALEHLINGVPLHDAVLKAWQWQPGWVFLLTSRFEYRRSDAAARDARRDGG